MSGVSVNRPSFFGHWLLVVLVFFLACMYYIIKHAIGHSPLVYQYYAYSILFVVISYGNIVSVSCRGRFNWGKLLGEILKERLPKVLCRQLFSFVVMLLADNQIFLA